MHSEKNRFKARIDGRTYTIVGPRSEEHLHFVTGLVNERLAELKKLAPELSPEERAVLLAVNAVSDQVQSEREKLTLEKTAKEEKSQGADC